MVLQYIFIVICFVLEPPSWTQENSLINKRNKRGPSWHWTRHLTVDGGTVWPKGSIIQSITKCKLKTLQPLACLSGRCKLWDKMAEHMDTLFIMGYDSQDNVITASASSPLDKITEGVENYLKMGIPKEKLVLGVHWASYRYPCVYMNRHNVSFNSSG